jgi:hypothetical protein
VDESKGVCVQRIATTRARPADGRSDEKGRAKKVSRSHSQGQGNETPHSGNSPAVSEHARTRHQAATSGGAIFSFHRFKTLPFHSRSTCDRRENGRSANARNDSIPWRTRGACPPPDAIFAAAVLEPREIRQRTGTPARKIGIHARVTNVLARRADVQGCR